MNQGAGTTNVVSRRCARASSRHPIRDAIIAVTIAVLLSLGLVGELSGAREPDYPMLPVQQELINGLAAQGDCAAIQRTLDWPDRELSVRARAFRAEVKALHDQLGCATRD